MDFLVKRVVTLKGNFRCHQQFMQFICGSLVEFTLKQRKRRRRRLPVHQLGQRFVSSSFPVKR